MVKQQIKLEIIIDASQTSELQFFVEDNKQFKLEHMQSAKIPADAKDYRIEFNFPIVEKPGKFRIDPGLTRGKWLIKKITLKGLVKNIEFEGSSIIENFQPNADIRKFELINDAVFVESVGEDSNLLTEFLIEDYLNELTVKPVLYFIPFVFSLCLFLFVLYILNKKLQPFVNVVITNNHLLVLLFLIIISTSYIGMSLFPSSGNSENRVLASKPVFNFLNVVDYPKHYTAYFEDNFGFKKAYTTLNSFFKYTLFNTSSKPEIVAVGKESWLYSIDTKNVGDFQNLNLFTEEELQLVKNNLEEMYAFHEPRGIRFFVMILPSKSSVYPEFLPSFIKKKNTASKLNQLLDYMNANSMFKIIDLTKELIAEKENTTVYYKHDIHWNFEGGYLGYKKLMNRMAEFNPDLAPLPLSHYNKIFRYNHNADLSKQLSLENYLLNEEWYFEPKDTFSFELVNAPTYENTPITQATVRTQIKNSKLPKAVVYRDSFFNLIIPFFSEKFSDCIYLWTNEMTYEIIEKETPGYVVLEITEADIDKLLEENPDWLKKK
ncbi:MAG: hypothetical protein JNL69_07535 [Bacteroidia bacterium]|nr:hypothetical protein [Bacteroidia bacterium]